MPAFVKDEKAWADAKAAVHKQYPKLTEDDDRFWKLCNTVYHKMVGGTEKSYAPFVVIKSKRIVARRTFQGIPIAIETPAGQYRHWYDPFIDQHGKTRMEEVDYGEITGAPGLDGDNLDCFVGKHEDAPNAYLVMIRKPPAFTDNDEMKVFLGFRNQADALAQFQLCYSDPRFIGEVKAIPITEFRMRVLTGETMKSQGNGLWIALKRSLLWLRRQPKQPRLVLTKSRAPQLVVRQGRMGDAR